MNKSTKIIVTIIFTSLLVLGGFFMFLSNSEIPSNNNDVNVTPTQISTPTPTIEEEEIIGDYQLKTYIQDYEYRTSSQEDKNGEFAFEYPDTFEFTVIEDQTEDIRMCNDFIIKDEFFQITIDSNCKPWSADYYTLPTDYQVIFKRESEGVGSGDFYLIRVNKLNGKYLYSSAISEPGNELTSSEMVYDGYSIRVNGEDGHFGLLFFINVTIDSKNQLNIAKYLEIADTIVKSLRSNRI